MIRRVVTTVLFALLNCQIAFAGSGSLFAIQESGATLEAPAVITICANIRANVSCQQYTVNHTELGITTTTGRSYPLAGIKVDTSTFKVDNSFCQTVINGYCSLPINNQTPADIPITTVSVRLNASAAAHTQVDVAYTQLNIATGGVAPYTYSLFGGTLPAGTTLNTATGTVSGTPTTASPFHYTIQVTDSLSTTSTAITTGTIATQLVITPSASPDNQVSVAYSQVNTASGGTPPYTFSVASGSLPANTTLNTSTGLVSGTPTIASSYNYTINVVDSDGGTETTAPITGTIAGPVGLTVTPSTFKEVGVTYTQTNVASNGTAPFTYSLYSGTLPAGTSLNPSTGTVSGIPTTAGSFNYTIAVTDDDAAVAIGTSSGTISPQLAITPTASTFTEVGVSYSQTNAASGGNGTYTYSIASGAVPAGTAINSGSGTVSGTPTTAGAFSYTVRVVDTNGGSQTTSTISGTISPQLAITPTASTFTEVGVSYSQTNAASGGNGAYTYSIASGAVPAGTAINSGSGTVSGTPTTAGAFSYTVRVVDTNGGSQTTSTISGTISPQLAITPTASTFTEVGVSYSQTNAASGGNGTYTYSIASGAVPAGTAINSGSGTVSGTPTTAGAFSYTVRVVDTNGGSQTTSTISGTISPQLAITPTASTFTEVGVSYSQTNAASGGNGAYTYSIASGAVPAGTTISSVTGTVSGTPTTAGAFSYTVRVVDTNGGSQTTSTISGTISPQLAITPTASTFTEVGVSYSQTNAASGGNGAYTYSIASGAVPAGTTISSVTGTVSGTPTTAGAFSYTVRVVDTNGGSQTTSTISGTISPQLAITPTASTFTEVGVSYSQTNAASGGNGAYTYSIASGAVPAGTTISSVTGTVSGTPTTAGAFSYTVRVVDTNGGSQTTSTISGTISPQLAITPTASTFTEVGVSYSQTNAASGGNGAYTYSIASGAVPAGTTISSVTGTVSGTPTTAGAFSYTVRVVDTNGGSQTTSSIAGTISLGNQTITFTTTPPTTPTTGSTYTPNATATSGLPVTISIDVTSTGVCSMTGNTVNFDSIGTCTINANQAGNANYNAAPQVQQILNIASLRASTPGHDVSNGAINSASWQNRPLSSHQLTSISCPSTSSCMAVDIEGTAFRYEGTKWAPADRIDNGHAFKAVSCANPAYCVAVDTSGYAFVYNDGVWSSGIQFETSGEPVSISCPQASFCMVVDNNANAFSYNGALWSSAQPVGIAAELTAVSCASDTSCIAVDAHGNGSHYDGAVWTAGQDNPISMQGLTAVSCTPNSNGFCMAVDDAGHAFGYHNNTWTAPYDDGAIDSASFNSVSCLGSAFCMATDNQGGVLRYNGATWSAVSDIDETHSISSLSCPTSAFCMGVDNEGNAWQYHAKVANVVQTHIQQDDASLRTAVTQTIPAISKGKSIETYHITGLNDPESVHIDINNNLWIADPIDAKIYRLPASTHGEFNPDLATFVSINNPASTAPTSVVTDSDGNIYVTDNNNAIYIYPATLYQIPGKYAHATPSRVIIGKQAKLNAPLALALDQKRNIWVANQNNNSIVQFAAGIQKSDADTQPINTISGAHTQLDEPNSLFIDAAGNIWVTNAKRNEIAVFAAGTTGNTAPTCVISSAAIHNPTNIILDAQGNIYQSNDNTWQDTINIFEPVSANCGATTLSPTRSITKSDTSLGKALGLAIGYVF